MASNLLFCKPDHFPSFTRIIESSYANNEVDIDEKGCHILKKSELVQFDIYGNERISYAELHVPAFFDISNKKVGKLKIGGHILQYFAQTGLTPYKGVIDISHLCHQPRCIRFDHLSREPHKVNEQRKDCKRSGICEGHRDEHHLQYKKCILHY